MLSKLKDLICCPPEPEPEPPAPPAPPPEQPKSQTSALMEPLPNPLSDANDCRLYQPAELLGRGTFGQCYKLIDLGTQRSYAAKVILKSLPISRLYTPTAMAAREITVQRRLSHPHIVRLESFFEDERRIYIVLELCARGSLRELLQRRRSLSESEARYFVQQLGMGVLYLHGRRIVHRDLKQENLLLSEQLQLKIGDFGLATHLAHAKERKSMQCGTPDYTAPEMLAGQGYGLEVDIWAVGCILYELLHGAPPFDADTLERTMQKVRRAEFALSSALSPAAASLIGALLRLKPALRPAAQQLLQHRFLCHAELAKSLNACPCPRSYSLSQELPTNRRRNSLV